MNYNQSKAQLWLKVASSALPNLGNILAKAKSEVIIIGAGVFDLYSGQDWTPPLRRKTGDLDLSVGLIHGASDYEILKDELVKNGYTAAPKLSYRFFSPAKIHNSLTYIDLLAHPAKEEISQEFTKKVIGVGEDFSFQGFEFARLEAFQVDANLWFPNPIAMIGLKRVAYLDNPDGRVKDLADIAELGWGIVEKGTHFELVDLWSKIREHKDAKLVKEVIKSLGNGDSTTWD